MISLEVYIYYFRTILTRTRVRESHFLTLFAVSTYANRWPILVVAAAVAVNVA